MKRILLAFGDSHTAGAEIEEQYQASCYGKSYPAHIARHYGLSYENFAVSGGSNDWIIRQFMIRIHKAIIKNEPVLILCNFCEPSRTYVKLPGKILHCTPSVLFQDENTIEKLRVDEEFLPYYANYVRTNDDNFLNFKSLSQILIIQSICEQYNIPYVFHTSFSWYEGNWDLINKRNFFGHHNTETKIYDRLRSNNAHVSYSYWGRALHDEYWKNIIKQERWSKHLPEEYHKFWAKILINFIDEQKILDTTTESE